MNDTERVNDTDTEIINCEYLISHRVLVVKNKTKSYAKEIKNSEDKILNEHDMQASQANQLKCSYSYVNNIKQVININSSIHDRYQKLQKISLHRILNKGD